ncbi:GntR family transcriptional regulator [Affinibrenneria salicis]|uniref:GntR family transcriptional regulator n=1 Tax=Affinibrenneria salicis TaxID=2590031 RepID=A0A5J5FQ52_9GAMM|nr:GntR family transcriptional regulator [Affinibrenneria salicis]KAA8994994.1 GntR family transcriptional regulator [Affinibrenneria salicis]
MVEQKNVNRAAGMSLADGLKKALEKEIASGTLEPGKRLDEKEIAARFDVSRTPVREAFRLLAADGLVDLNGRQGVMVRALSVNTLLEMFQVMAELEGLCARLAARRISPEKLQQLQQIHQQMVDQGPALSPAAFYDMNLTFHEAIYSIARNEFLAEETRALRNRVGVYRRRVTFHPGRVMKTLEEHSEIIQSIAHNDGDAAHAAMRKHLTLLGDDLVDFIAGFS